MSDPTCPHGDKQWRCPTCCLLELRRNLPRLDQAVSVRDKTVGGGPRPAFGSREPINVSALALLQDIRKAGGCNGIEHNLATISDPEGLAALRKSLRGWRSRSALILRDALAPYELVWPVHGPRTNKNGEPLRNDHGVQVEGWQDRPVLCPVVNDEGDCASPLLVHREDDPGSVDYGKATVIRCRRHDDHEWPLAHGGWLRLGVLLGGTMGETG